MTRTRRSVLASLAGLSSLTAVNGNVTIYRNTVLPPASVDAFRAEVNVTGTIPRIRSKNRHEGTPAPEPS